MTVHTAEYAGQSIEDKLSAVRDALKKGKKRAVGTVVNMLDEVAWLFNLRGTDIPFNPVFFAYGIVTETEATIFVDAAKLSDDVYKALGQSVKVKPYEEIITACHQLGKTLRKGEKVRDEGETELRWLT